MNPNEVRGLLRRPLISVGVEGVVPVGPNALRAEMESPLKLVQRMKVGRYF